MQPRLCGHVSHAGPFSTSSASTHGRCIQAQIKTSPNHHGDVQAATYLKRTCRRTTYAGAVKISIQIQLKASRLILVVKRAARSERLHRTVLILAMSSVTLVHVCLVRIRDSPNRVIVANTRLCENVLTPVTDTVGHAAACAENQYLAVSISVPSLVMQALVVVAKSSKNHDAFVARPSACCPVPIVLNPSRVTDLQLMSNP